MYRIALSLLTFLLLASGAIAGVVDQLEIRHVAAATFTKFDYGSAQDGAWGWRSGIEVWSKDRFGFSLGYQDFGSSFEDYGSRDTGNPVLVTSPRIGDDYKERLQARGTYGGLFGSVPVTRSLSAKLELGAIYLFRARRTDLSLSYAHDYAYVPQDFEDIRPYGRFDVVWSPRPGFSVIAGVFHTGGNGRVRTKQDPAVDYQRGQPHLRLTSYELGFTLRPKIGRWRNLDWSVSVGPSIAAVSWLEATDVTWGYTLKSAFVLGHRVEFDATYTNFARAKHQYFGRLLDLDPIHREWDGEAIDMDTTRLALSRDFEISPQFSIRPSLGATYIRGWAGHVPVPGRQVIVGPTRFYVYLSQWQFSPGLDLTWHLNRQLSVNLGAQHFPLQIPNPFIFEPARSEADPSAHVTTASLLMRWSF